MPEQSTDQRFEVHFALAPDGDAFVASITNAGTGDQIAALQLPRGLVTATVLKAHPVALELRSNGQLVAFDREMGADLAKASLGEIFSEMLKILSRDDETDLVKLEAILELSLFELRELRSAFEAD